ncbi:TonB-dependent receptor domain-containing protein [Neptunomonas qingdaonensis]|uniref:Iron complex outermembrane recepter protein n=1 Tax=Neptunomonas qingdaonensis TaxID=1045558 RepID=A0A1I2SQH5_9GAMM|nr:TonB-dependent receptor [Neptunomonas qingdaonensis]SFG55104.1 iron complex outermembrane recepter protein [Neptunomonas qingdaonensis]
MKSQWKMFYMCCSVVSVGVQVSVQADESPLFVEVTRGALLDTSVSTFTSESVAQKPGSDMAELLRSVNGVSGTRMGGRAIDPIIRGQQATQLNVLLDGAYLHGGCPNRMDPPTTYASGDSYDLVTLFKGSQTVLYGSGGSGGTLVLSRHKPVFNEQGYAATVTGVARSNGEGGTLSADVATGNDQGYFRFKGEVADMDSYEDGNGDIVRSAYRSRAAALIVGAQLGENTDLTMSYDRNEERDVLFAGANMDSPESNADIYRVKLEHRFDSGTIQQMKAELFQSNVDHLMDSYSLRDKVAGMYAPSSSDTRGGRVIFDGWLGAHQASFGADYQSNTRNGLVYSYPANMPMGQLWPDVTIEQVGVFGEVNRTLSARNRVKLGLRYDYITADVNNENDVFMMNQTAATLYGATPEQQREYNIAGFTSWQHQLNQNYQLEMTASRSVRTADATERYMAKSNWVGNPWLAPEKHHQLEWVLSNTDKSPWSLSAYYNRIDDYILRYRDSSIERYRNVEAEIYGVEFEHQHRLNAQWLLNSSLSYTLGNNLDTGEPLSRISPLTARLQALYQSGQWGAGITSSLVASQSEVCLASSDCAGLDVTPTSGYGLVDLFADYRLSPAVTLAAGIDNVFDKTYRVHESRDDVFDPTPLQVNEPGRSVWMKLSGKF